MDYAVYSLEDELLFVGNIDEVAEYIGLKGKSGRRQVRRMVRYGDDVPAKIWDSHSFKIFEIEEFDGE